MLSAMKPSTLTRIALAASSLLLGACVSSLYLAATAERAITDATLAADDGQLTRYCERYGGEVREFEPDLSQGVRLYTLVDRSGNVYCPRRCTEFFQAGYAFVEVHGYRDQQSLIRRVRIERFVPGETEEWPRSLGVQSDPGSPVEAVETTLPNYRSRPVGTRSGDEFARSGTRLIELRGRFAGVIEGSFSGVRRIEDGALYGSGGFRLRKAGDIAVGGGATMARCREQGPS
jgi:hypothetical protein